MVLLDSNIISEMLKTMPNAGVEKWMAKQTSLAVSVISLDEVMYGLQRKRMMAALARFEHLLKIAEIVALDENMARTAASLRSDFSQQGIARSQQDMQIAATAIARECTLATRNTKDFAGCGLRLVNPFSFVLETKNS
jgi:toxin FitB